MTSRHFQSSYLFAGDIYPPGWIESPGYWPTEHKHNDPGRGRDVKRQVEMQKRKLKRKIGRDYSDIDPG